MKIGSYAALVVLTASAAYPQQIQPANVQAKPGDKIVLEVKGNVSKDDDFVWKIKSGKGRIQYSDDPKKIDFTPDGSQGTIIVVCTVVPQKGKRKEIEAEIRLVESAAAAPEMAAGTGPVGPLHQPPTTHSPAPQPQGAQQPSGDIAQLGFQPTGFMGSAQDGDTIELNQGNHDLPLHSGRVNIKIAYTPQTARDAPAHSRVPWVAIAWQYPGGEPNWGELPGRNLETNSTEANRYLSLRVWARGVVNAGELPTVQFKSGGGTAPALQEDKRASYEVVGPFHPLTAAWAEYCLDLRGQKLTNVVSAFTIVMERAGNPNGAIVYLNDIHFSNQSCPAGGQH